jgi:hypothetical protein
MLNLFRVMTQSFEEWKKARKAEKTPQGQQPKAPRPPSEVGSIRSTMSRGTLEDRLARVEDAITQLQEHNVQQTAALTKQSELLSRLLTQLTASPQK